MKISNKYRYYCIISTSGTGGVWSVVKESLPLLNKCFDVHLIIYTQKNDLHKQVLEFITFHNIKYHLININTSNGWLFDIYRLLKIRKLKKIIGNHPSIIHSHDSYNAGCYLYSFRNTNHKLFCTFHGALIESHSKLKRWIQHLINIKIRIRLLEHSNIHFISCDPLSVSIIKSYFQNKNIIIDVATNGVKPSNILHTRNEEQTFKIGYISRLHPLKGWKLLAIAVDELISDGLNLELYIAGTGECENEVKEWCQNHNHANYLGNITEIRENLFPIIDLHVLPTEYPEGLPMILLETMSAKIPSITTDIGSCAYAIKDGVNGLIIRPNVTDLKSAISKLYSNTQLYEEMQLNGYKIWEEKFSSESMVKQYYKIIKRNLS